MDEIRMYTAMWISVRNVLVLIFSSCALDVYCINRLGTLNLFSPSDELCIVIGPEITSYYVVVSGMTTVKWHVSRTEHLAIDDGLYFFESVEYIPPTPCGSPRPCVRM